MLCLQQVLLAEGGGANFPFSLTYTYYIKHDTQYIQYGVILIALSVAQITTEVKEEISEEVSISIRVCATIIRYVAHCDCVYVVARDCTESGDRRDQVSQCLRVSEWDSGIMSGSENIFD
jgi:hypothetical protein